MDSTSPTKRPLMPHQQEWLDKTWMLDYWAYFHATGTGKSAILVNVAQRLYQCQEIDACVILTMTDVHREWVQSNIPDDCLVPFIAENLEPGESWDIEKYIKASALVFLVFNIEALNNQYTRWWLTEFFKRQKILLAIDESTLIKNPTAKRKKYCVELANHAEYRRILSGEPAAEKPFDLWAQADFLSEDIYKCNYGTFMNRYGVPSVRHMGKRSIIEYNEYRDIDQLREHLTTWSSRVDKSVLNLDEPLRRTIPVKLDKKLRKFYDTVRKRSLIETTMAGNDINLEIMSVIARLYKLQSVLSGFVVDDEGRVVQLHKPKEPPAKVRALLSLLSTLPKDEQVIIRVAQKPECHILENYIGSAQATYVNGDLPKKLREKAYTDFKLGHKRVLIMTYGLGTHGLNLQNANHCVFFSGTWSYDKRHQSEDRIYRKGQERTCHFYDLLIEDSVDYLYKEAVETKRNISALLFNEPGYIVTAQKDVADLLNLLQADDSKEWQQPEALPGM